MSSALPKKSTAFTLVELLVVVAILAILLALILPAVPPMAARTDATKCMNNLRIIGNDIHHYLADSGGTYFQSTSTETWPHLLDAYSRDWEHFRSPFDRTTAGRPAVFAGNHVPISYGLNHKLFDTCDTKWKVTEATLIQAAPAIDYASIGELKFRSDAYSDQNLAIRSPGASGALGSVPLGTHQRRQRINALFADGHVQEMEWSAFAADTAPTGAPQWNPQ